MFKTMVGVVNPKYKPKKEDILKIPSFVFCRWLSGNRATIATANEININYNIPIENQYYMVRHLFMGKVGFIPYPKQVQNEDTEVIEHLVDYFKISHEKAREYVKIIDKNELNDIIKMYNK